VRAIRQIRLFFREKPAIPVDIKEVCDSLDHSALCHKTTLPLLKNFMKDKTPPFVDDEGGHHYICSYDYGHMGFTEMPFLFEPDVDYKNVLNIENRSICRTSENRDRLQESIMNPKH